MVFGAASVQNRTTISPSLVLITATSFDEFMGVFSSFFSSAASAAVPNNIAVKIDNFIPFCSGGLRHSQIRADSDRRSKTAATVVFLQTAHLNFSFLYRPNPVRAGQCGAHRRHDRELGGKRSIADDDFVLSWNFSARSVDDEIDVAVLDAIENVRASLVNFEDLGYLDSSFRKRLGGSAGGNDFKAELHKLPRNRDYRFLVGVLDADEDFSLFRQRWWRGHLRFCVGQAEIDIHAHHFARRFHLGTQRNIEPFIA